MTRRDLGDWVRVWGFADVGTFGLRALGLFGSSEVCRLLPVLGVRGVGVFCLWIRNFGIGGGGDPEAPWLDQAGPQMWALDLFWKCMGTDKYLCKI